MKTRVALLFVFMLICTAALTVNGQIQKRTDLKINPTLGGEATLIKIENEVSSNESYTNFELSVPVSGNYYVNFWLLPTQLANGSYSTFKVLVNGIYAGQIIPVKGNWQTIGLSDHRMVDLQQGVNVLSVVAEIPEVPEIEFVRLSKTAAKSQISSVAYDSYLSKVKNIERGLVAPDMGERISEAGFYREIETRGDYNRSQIFANLPLKYSIHKRLFFTAGEKIFISSQSSTEHVLEFFYEDQPEFSTWLNVSKKSQNAATQLAMLQVTIPITGYYLMKARSAVSGVSGTVNINVDGKNYYQDVPIYYMGRSYVIPANGTAYCVYTQSDAKDYSDPYLFIEGGGTTPGKVVALNDNAPLAKRTMYRLTPNDAYVGKKYAVPTNGFHVTTFASSDPEKYCSVIAGMYDVDAIPQIAPTRSIGGSADGTTGISGENKVELSVYPNPANVSSVLEIVSGESFKEICVYNVSGKMLQCREDIVGTSLQIPLSGLNIDKPGIYIIKLKGASETFTRKIIVK